MSMIIATEIRVGTLLQWKNHLWKVLKCYHVHVGGRGGAYMQVEIKDIERGTKTNHRFNSDEKVDKIYVDARDMEYLYKEGESYIFMDQENFEQFSLHQDILDIQAGFLTPNLQVQINFHNSRPIAVSLPTSVIIEVGECDPYIKGATATVSFKPAVLVTGSNVLVPPFIESGDKIKINTDTGEYMERM